MIIGIGLGHCTQTRFQPQGATKVVFCMWSIYWSSVFKYFNVFKRFIIEFLKTIIIRKYIGNYVTIVIFFPHNRCQKGGISNLNFHIFHPSLMQFLAKCLSLWVAIYKSKKEINNLYEKRITIYSFHTFWRYTQFLYVFNAFFFFELIVSRVSAMALSSTWL